MRRKSTPKKSSASRREFIKTSALGLGALGTLSSTAMANSVPEPGTVPTTADHKDLILKMTGYPFDRLKALIDGKVSIPGCKVQFDRGKISDMNTDIFSGAQTYDVSEIGLHPFMLAYANDGFRDYTLLPAFPLRLFRHKSVFIRGDGDIKIPEDLKGKKIGTPGYSSTSLTWIRGIFQDEYGLHPKDVQWVMAQKDSSASVSGKASKQETLLPEGIDMVQGPPGMNESEMLINGEVDALFHAAEPKAFAQGDTRITRLFPDSRWVEQNYYKKTGIFPIMHAVAIRKSLIAEHPWLPRAVFDAYSRAKEMNYQFMKKSGWVMNALPWFGQELDATRELMGKNFWPYGIEPNRKTLEALFRYSHDQGLCSQLLKVEDLFLEESLTYKEDME